MSYSKAFLCLFAAVTAGRTVEYAVNGVLQWSTFAFAAVQGVIMGLVAMGLLGLSKLFFPKARLKRSCSMIIEGDQQAVHALCHDSLKQFDRKAYVLDNDDLPQKIVGYYFSHMKGESRITFDIQSRGPDCTALDFAVEASGLFQQFDFGQNTKVRDGIRAFFESRGAKAVSMSE